MEEELFSDDPEEHLKIENDILKIKLQAELGGDFESEEELPPEIENAFLKNVIEFEHQFANATTKTLYEVLDSPPFEEAENMSDIQVEQALQDIEELMLQKGVEVDYGDDYSARLKYCFVTEELFLKESPFFHVPGMMMHYIYEEFYPNHRLDIKRNAEYFSEHWFNRNFNEYSNEVSPELVTADGKTLTREELFEKFKHIFDSYTTFENTFFSIDNVSFELHEDETGQGFAEGFASYDAILENGETQHFEGPYKLYMHFDGWWNIFYFVWPGFRW